MGKFMTFVAFAACIGLSAYSSWQRVLMLPGY